MYYFVGLFVLFVGLFVNAHVCTWVYMYVCGGFRLKSVGAVLLFEMVFLIGPVFTNLVRLPG